MNDVTTQHVRRAVRASDAEREQAVALLQRGFADGRLALAEFEERVGAAYAARTRAQLRDLTADLPATEQPTRPGLVLDRRLLCILLCVCPPRAWPTGCCLSAKPPRCEPGGGTPGRGSSCWQARSPLVPGRPCSSDGSGPSCPS